MPQATLELLMARVSLQSHTVREGDVLQDKDMALRRETRPLTHGLPPSSGLTQRKDFGANCLKEEKPSVWAKARDGNTQRWTWM